MKSGLSIGVTWLACLGLAACTTSAPRRAFDTPEALQRGLEKDLGVLRSLNPSLTALDDEFRDLHEQGGWRKRGYFSAAESERMEILLFRFVSSHSTLLDIAIVDQGEEGAFGETLGAKAHVVSRQAGLLLASHTAFLVQLFADDDVAASEMNEASLRSDIPRDTFRKIEKEVSPERLSRLTAAGTLAAKEQSDPDSALSRLSADPVYGPLIERNTTLQTEAERRMRAAVDKLGWTSHVAAAEVAGFFRDIEEGFGDALYAMRALLFKDVSRLKSPKAKLVRFSEAQKRQVQEALEPGDLIFTYTAGYMSDVFIPGAFKHGITWVGSPDDRRAAGLSATSLPATAPPGEHERLGTHFTQSQLADGKQADMIEAVAEGVIFNNLAYVMDTHINRLLVLRPNVTEEERVLFLVEVFSYLGEDYDFEFDFADASRQVCTEVIHRSLDGKGGIGFKLTKRGGHETLSADDIVHYYLDTHPRAFDFVLYAEEDPHGKHHAARILTAAAGRKRLSSLMASASE